jgi:hypothetical protein
LPKKPPPKPKAPAKAGGESTLFDALKSLDEETLARLRDSLRAEFLGEEDDDDPLELFGEFLDRVEETADPQADADFFEDLIAVLSQLAIEENGGDPQARDLRASIYEKLDEALSEARFDPSALVLIAKVLNDSGWIVPERLKTQLVDALDASPESGAFDLGGALDEIAEAVEGDAFTAYDAVNSVLAAFPSDVAAKMVATLGQTRAPSLLHALAGFVMHRDGRLAASAIEELRRLAEGPVESALVERLVRMRPWLPSERQTPLDEAIRALRAQAREPVELERPKSVKCFVMACDGSGAGGALASMKAADGWRFVAAMTKTSGVEEVLSIEAARKAEVDQTVRGMRENVVAAQTDAAGLARYLQLALGENVATKSPPPFKLIAFVESLGLGPLAPRQLSPGDLIAEIIDGLPPGLKDANALKLAHEATTGGALEQPWFEAGEPVERLLGPIRTHKARVKALLTAYLPQRREFWTRACALTAFALELDRKTYGLMGVNLALVGREIADGKPLEGIPLMREIAEATVQAYQSRR